MAEAGEEGTAREETPWIHADDEDLKTP